MTFKLHCAQKTKVNFTECTRLLIQHESWIIRVLHQPTKHHTVIHLGCPLAGGKAQCHGPPYYSLKITTHTHNTQIDCNYQYLKRDGWRWNGDRTAILKDKMISYLYGQAYVETLLWSEFDKEEWTEVRIQKLSALSPQLFFKATETITAVFKRVSTVNNVEILSFCF